MKYAMFIYLILLASLLAGCAQPGNEIPDMWWVVCDHSLQAPLNRVGSANSSGYFRSKGELYGCLPTPVGGTVASMRRVALSVHLTNLKAGDTIIYNGHVEMTNDTYVSDVMYGWSTVLATSYTNPDGTVVNRDNATNCTPTQHHCVIYDSGVYQIQQDIPDAYLNFVVYANNAGETNAFMVIENTYGMLEGLILVRHRD